MTELLSYLNYIWWKSELIITIPQICFKHLVDMGESGNRSSSQVGRKLPTVWCHWSQKRVCLKKEEVIDLVTFGRSVKVSTEVTSAFCNKEVISDFSKSGFNRVVNVESDLAGWGVNRSWGNGCRKVCIPFKKHDCERSEAEWWLGEKEMRRVNYYVLN